MEGMELTIHWHGVWQRGTQYSDGVPYVTQCPILNGNSFRYQWYAGNAGTHFWHAHTGTEPVPVWGRRKMTGLLFTFTFLVNVSLKPCQSFFVCVNIHRFRLITPGASKIERPTSMVTERSIVIPLVARSGPQAKPVRTDYEPILDHIEGATIPANRMRICLTR